MALSLVARNGTPQIFGLYLQSTGYLLPVNRYGETLLHTAAIGGQIEIVKELITSGEDINITSSMSRAATRLEVG